MDTKHISASFSFQQHTVYLFILFIAVAQMKNTHTLSVVCNIAHLQGINDIHQPITLNKSTAVTLAAGDQHTHTHTNIQAI